jgi:hypothetical protein
MFNTFYHFWHIIRKTFKMTINNNGAYPYIYNSNETNHSMIFVNNHVHPHFGFAIPRQYTMIIITFCIWTGNLKKTQWFICTLYIYIQYLHYYLQYVFSPLFVYSLRFYVMHKYCGCILFKIQRLSVAAAGFIV